ncbi:PIG-L deacetylase family protein [Nafulsella turpanensis]|uniref:PIG-L deacetylase family protein n=1 Tax=Nafulsella turpanensis TaxID=1265690 RepID=UPI000348E7D2|nr:PIG-L family deacetylase [Nafulsella turpanensis]
MKYLYIFPHPDDESFGPAAAMHQQLEQGHEVHLLTLTKGGATKQRHRLGLSIEEMGEVRYQEMLAVEESLGLSSMAVLDFPDSGLAELDPRQIEEAVHAYIEEIKPDILVSYPVHGISGFHDHLVMHAVAKRVFLQMKDEGAAYPKRLAFFTLPDSGAPSMQNGEFRMKLSAPELIDCIVPLRPEDQQAMVNSLKCYETYKDTIEATGVVEQIGDKVHFEIFNEVFEPPIHDLSLRLP